MRNKGLLAIAALAVVMAAPVLAQKTGPAKGDEIAPTDNMSIARVLFSDGLYERASVVLETVNPDDPAVDPAEYWLLRGLVDLNLGKNETAADYLLAAMSKGNRDPRIFLLRAQALVSSNRLEEAVRVLERAPAQVKAIPQSYTLRANVLYQLGRKHGAYRALDEGFAAFPDNEQMERQRMFLLIELGLYQAALEAAEVFFAHRESGPDDYVALAQALLKGSQVERAKLLLEQANLRFPNHPKIRTQLAVVYLEAGAPVVAAEVLRPLAWVDADKAMPTAELYRKGGAYGRAVRMNQRVEDQKAKIRQRLSLLLEQEHFEQAANLYPRVARLGLLEEQGIVYAMAYAFYQTREFDRAETLLSQLTDERLFEQGIQIRQGIEACRQAKWQCD